MLRISAAFAAFAFVVISAPAAGQSADRRIVIEAGVGDARHRPLTSADRLAGAASDRLISGHLSLGYAASPSLAVFLSEDGGSDLEINGTSQSYQYSTAFAELALPSVPYVALRVGGGRATTMALSSGLHGAGAIARLGVAVRTPTTRPVSALVEVDGFTGVSGHYSTHSGALSPDLRPAFRPTSIQLSLGLRANIPLP